VVEPDTFRRYRRHSVVTAFGIAMLLTPPDVITQVALAGCMTLLYEAAIVIGSRVAQERQEV
jgi:Sec-independent protein secretion pathway component TatC